MAAGNTPRRNRSAPGRGAVPLREGDEYSRGMNATTSDAPGQEVRFTTVMPVHNHAEYVAEAIHSVRRQTRDDWELIVVDDGSTDAGGQIIDELAGEDDRIVAVHQANAGPAAARNAGILRASGRWMTYLDSDDLWFPDALERYAAYLDAHPDARFIYGYRHRMDADGSVTELPGEYQDRPTGTRELFGRMFLSHLCVCYRRDLLLDAGLYDEDLRSCEDYELYLRLSLHTRFEPIAATTGLRRRHGTNLSRQTGRSRMVEAEVLRRFVTRQGGAEVLDEELIARRLGRLYYAAGRQYFKSRRYRQSLAALTRAHRYRRTPKSTLVQLAATLLRPLARDPDEPLPEL